jgi:hypothetical protein
MGFVNINCYALIPTNSGIFALLSVKIVLGTINFALIVVLRRDPKNAVMVKPRQAELEQSNTQSMVGRVCMLISAFVDIKSSFVYRDNKKCFNK